MLSFALFDNSLVGIFSDAVQTGVNVIMLAIASLLSRYIWHRISPWVTETQENQAIVTNEGPSVSDETQFKSLESSEPLTDEKQTPVTELVKPSEGATNWHEPLNRNFRDVSKDIRHLANQLGVPVTAEYNQPQEGTLDWHIPLNNNFDMIEEDIQSLAQEAGVSDVEELTQPEKGSLDWHVPLNNNFESIENNLNKIAEAV
jgi:hypothetical protein